MVVPVVGCLVEHLDDHLTIAFVEEGEQAACLEVVGASKLVPPSVQVRLALLVEQDLDRPPAKAASGLPQLQFGRLNAVDELGKLFLQPLYAEGVLVDAEDELKAPRLLRK